MCKSEWAGCADNQGSSRSAGRLGSFQARAQPPGPQPPPQLTAQRLLRHQRQALQALGVAQRRVVQLQAQRGIALRGKRAAHGSRLTAHDAGMPYVWGAAQLQAWLAGPVVAHH